MERKLPKKISKIDSGIYQIINLVNGKKYVGRSLNIKKRLAEHKSNLRKNMHPNKHLQFSYNKHGLNNFKFSVLEEACGATYINREQWYLDNYIDFDKDYNNSIWADMAVSKSSFMFTEKEWKIIVKMVTAGCHSRKIVKRFPKCSTHRLSKIFNKNYYRTFKISKTLKEKFKDNNNKNRKLNGIALPDKVLAKIYYLRKYLKSTTKLEKLLKFNKDKVYSIITTLRYKNDRFNKYLTRNEKLELFKLLKNNNYIKTRT